MKTFLLLLLIIVTGFTASATTYYFSNSGSDANNGTSAATPWQSLAKFNSVFASKSAGDNFLFNRGETYYGNLTVSRSGASGSPITIGAYGSGANPIITGFTNVTAWTNLGGNIWESSSAVTTLPTCNMVAVNGVNTPMGRYPNSGFLIYSGHSGSASITSSSLSGTPNWTGATVVLRSIPWMLEVNVITSHTGSTLNYTGGSSAGTNGYGFFIQNDPKTLDTANEWYYNPSTKKIRIYSSSLPLNVQVPTVDELILNSSASFITFDHIDLKGSNSSLFENRNGKSVIIQNCNFSFAGKDGVYINNAASANETMTIDGNTFNDISENAMNFLTWTSNVWVKNNTINNVGMIAGAGYTNQNQGDGIVVKGANSIVEYNSLTNICHSGIYMNHSDHITIRNNYIANFGMVRYDAGGVYSWNADTLTVTSRIIDHNIIVNSNQISSGIGAASISVFGIYLDGSSTHVTISNNTLSNCISEGIHVLNSGSTTITGNTCYNNGSQLGFWHAFGGGMAITGMVVKNNNFFSKTKSQLAFYYRDDTNPFNTFGLADSNYYSRPIDNNLTIQTEVVYTGTDRALSGWQTLSGQDAHSSKLAKTISDTNDLRFEYNATGSAKTVSLPYNYIDVKNVAYNGTITLAPYASAVLIKNGAITGNIAPVAEAGANQLMYLPVNNTNITGSGTDADGTVKSYSWTKLSGPAATIVSPNSKSSSVTGFLIGSYKFQLTVTDNKGATGKDSMLVNVIAGTLPLNLITFKGQLVNGKVGLTWKTANEINVSGFDIERMTTNAWGKIGFIQSTDGSLASYDYAFSDNLPQAGFNFYRLKIVDMDGKFVYSDIIKVELKAGKSVVYQNVPNPFRDVTTIRYELADKAPVKIMVFNSIGIQVDVLTNEIKEPGIYQIQWNASKFPSGNYFYTVIIGNNVTSKKMLKIN